MLRLALLPFVLVASLTASAIADPEAGKPTPTPTPAPRATPAAKKPKDVPKRVFTNDDLEAGRDKPSAVQDLSATGTTVRPEAPLPNPDSQAQEVATPVDPRTEQERRIADAEAQVKSLDAQANELLWMYLQSTDTNEIMRLKAEQQEVLDRLKEARAELARLKGEAGSEPAPTPTRQPG